MIFGEFKRWNFVVENNMKIKNRTLTIYTDTIHNNSNINNYCNIIYSY